MVRGEKSIMATTNSRHNYRPLAEINVTPFVDVMLVLLIIFMVAAPLVQHGVDVDLPKATTKNIAAEEELLTITLTKDKKIFLNKMQVEKVRLKEKLIKIFKQRTDNQLLFKADRTLPYEFVIQVMAEIKNAGIEKLGIITSPAEN
jgi:biopolymer transport protein TolR